MSELNKARIPNDDRLVKLASVQPIGWWNDHARHSACCRTGEPSCDLGHALSRLSGAEMRRKT